MKPATFNVSWNWVEYAHGPGAESGQPLATELCALPVNKAGQVEIPLARRDLIEEVKSVAELYVGGDVIPGVHLQAARVIARCNRVLKTAYWCANCKVMGEGATCSSCGGAATPCGRFV